MFSWRSDFGLAGYFEKEICEQLTELIASEGFRSDPDQVAVEKLSCCSPSADFLVAEYKECRALHSGSSLLRPFSVAYVKGWKRAVALLITLQGIRELSLEDSIDHFLRVSMGTIHVNFAFRDADARSKVLVGRGATMASAVRKSPNCFNLLRQIEVLQKAGNKNNAEKILEAERFLARLEYQFDNAPITLRKALQFKEASRVHLATGLYLALLDKFSQVAPPSEFRHLKASLDTQFNAGYLDGELFHMADEQ
ncbi:unnamed protein product, partial [Durusdinium trenchii]